MNRNRVKPLNNMAGLAGLAGLVLGIAMFLVPASVFGQAFEGSAYCKNCHAQNYQDWSASGHPFKLMKSEQARYRPIPLPLGTTWDDVSYVIGGYKWKSRYMDKEGYIITVTEDKDGNPVNGRNQYNYLTGEWVNYEAGAVKKPYDCGICHTTNWVQDVDAATDNDLTDNQDGLPGIHGKFDVGGIHCEQCHGNGMTMNVDDSAAACGACHYRTAAPGAEVNVIPAGGGFINHHEQYNEHLAGPHANMKCTTCHNPHKRGEFSIKEGRACENCHVAQATSYAKNSMFEYGVECKDCHMPYASKSANQLGPYEGDLQTHLFYINTDASASMFTPDGKFVALDQDGKGAATLDFACVRCHETLTKSDLSAFAKNFHGTAQGVSQLQYIGLNPGLTGNWWGGPSRNGEGFLLEVAESGGVLTLIVSFYTYDKDGKQVWLIGVGPANTGMTSNVEVFIASGRKWGESGNQADFTKPFGTGTFTFPACDVGSFSITPNASYSANFTAIGYDLSRDITVSKVACPSLLK